LKSPVLLLVFNRPEPARLVFESIRSARPPRLYIAADGPRPEMVGDAVACAEVRRLATEIDWPCRVTTLFGEQNLGCKQAVSSALDWFFQHEPEGIVVEDDCLPSADFFPYCDYLLDRYREDKDVWHINGNNFGLSDLGGSTSHCFGSLAQVWGWATWSDRWRQREMNPFHLAADSNPEVWPIKHRYKVSKLAHLGDLQRGLCTWDYQWQITVLNQCGLVICPANNLVSNLGNDPDATHTRARDRRTHLPLGGWSPPEALPNKVRSAPVDDVYARHMGLTRKRNVVRWHGSRLLEGGTQAAQRALRSLLTDQRGSVVVASTGRAGSTMLLDAVLGNWIKREWCDIPIAKLRRFLYQFAPRLEGAHLESGVVYKTHDFPPQNPTDYPNTRFLFVYGDPLDAAFSVQKMAQQESETWLEMHFYHLGGRGSAADLFDVDILNYEDLLKAWRNVAACENVMLLKYDNLWNEVEQLAKFLKLPLRLPAKRVRAPVDRSGTRVNEKLFGRLRALYDDDQSVSHGG